MDAPPHPGNLPGLSALKGHKPTTYVILGGGVLVGAYFIHKREVQNTPTDTTAADAAGQGQDAAFAPTYGSDGGYYPGGTQGAVGSVDQTGAYQGLDQPGGSGLIPLGNGLLWDPSNGNVYGAIMPTDGFGDGGSITLPNVPSQAGTGGGLPPGPQPNPAPAPVVTGQSPQPTTWSCPSAYPHQGTNPNSCYKDVCLKSGDGHGHGPGLWHVYRDGTWHQVKSGSC